MKVLNLIEEGRFGGPHNRIISVANELKNLKIQTIVVYAKADSKIFKEKLDKNKIESYSVNISRPTSERLILIRYLLNFPIEIIRVIRIFKKIQPDIVHVNGTHQIKGVFASIFLNIPFIWHVNDNQFPKFIRNNFKWFSKYAYGVLFSSNQCKEFYKDELKNLNTTNIQISRPPIDIQFFKKKNNSIKDKKVINIYSVANVNPVKGIDKIIEIAENININKSNDLEYKFYLIGTFQKSQKAFIEKVKEMIVEKKLSDSVYLMGYQDNIKEHLQNCDLYLCASTNETGPIALFEAMSMGIPFVSTDVGDINEVNNKIKGGIVCPVNDVIELSKAVLNLTNDIKLYDLSSKNARLLAEEYFDAKVASLKHKSVYLNLD